MNWTSGLKAGDSYGGNFYERVIMYIFGRKFGYYCNYIFAKTLFKRYTHAFCYYIWLAVVIRMIVPFKIPIYLSQEVYKFFG